MNRLHGLSFLAAGLVASLAACTSAQDGGLRTIDVAGAPKAAGPYAQGVVANGFLYTTGQLARDPATGKLVDGDISVVKVTVYMTDLADFPKLNEVFGARFGGHRPARSTVQVSKLPSNAQLEIDVVARLPR